MLKRLFAVASLCLGSLLFAASAQAAAPMVKTQAPGYYRMMLGDFEITALSDGTVALPVDKLLKEPAARTNALLSRADLKAPLETSVNAFLVNTGSKLILIDTGAGALFGPTLGNLANNLKASGYQPEQVDEIYITHFHPDHVGGLVSNGNIVFPNAIVRADQHDPDFWLSDDNLNKASADDKGFFQGARASLEPYIKAGKFKPFNGPTELAPGIRAISTYGHTVGHTSYEITSGGQKLIVVGDLIHVAAVQLAHPEVTIAFDTDTKAAAIERKKIFDQAAQDAEWIAAAHLSFPGVGHLRKAGKGYEFLPANYTTMLK